MPWGSSDISYALYGKQGHLLRAVNQPWGSREHLQSMHGADVSQQQGLTSRPWWLGPRTWQRPHPCLGL